MASGIPCPHKRDTPCFCLLGLMAHIWLRISIIWEQIHCCPGPSPNNEIRTAGGGTWGAQIPQMILMYNQHGATRSFPPT